MSDDFEMAPREISLSRLVLRPPALLQPNLSKKKGKICHMLTSSIFCGVLTI
eukprot:gene21808-28829_t